MLCKYMHTDVHAHALLACVFMVICGHVVEAVLLDEIFINLEVS